MIAIDDDKLQGLAEFQAEDLERITGASRAQPIRLRYRAGRRAILHVRTGSAPGEQGVLWFFRGGKAKRLARCSEAARFDLETGAIFEAFPDDCRMPQIRTFLESYNKRAPILFGTTPLGPPEPLRYRPGLSCTFRCPMVGGKRAYVKLIYDDDVLRLESANRELISKTKGGPLRVAPALGVDPEIGAISYGEARGLPLDEELNRCANADPVLQALDALRRLTSLDLRPVRRLDRDALLHRAQESAQLVLAIVPQAQERIEDLLARLEREQPRLVLEPIHADVKLEHLFLNGGQTTLIDTESLALGPADYDLAQLYGRLWQAEYEGELSRNLVRNATREVRRSAGSGFRWCLDVVAIRLAKYYAQRPALDARIHVCSILDRLAWSYG